MANELKLIRGDTPSYKATIKSNGVVFDLTDYTCYFTVKKSREDKNADAIIGPITGNILVADEGTVEFPLTSIDSDVEEGKYYYDIEIQSTTDTYTPINSMIYVELDVKK